MKITTGGTMLASYRERLEQRRLSPKTIRLRLYYVHRFHAHIEDSLLTATAEDVDGFIHGHEDWERNTVMTALASLNSFYDWAVKAGLLPDNPAADIYKPRPERRKARIAPDAAIISGLRAATTSAQKAMLLLGAECGLRVAEIATLNRGHRSGEWLTITGKGGHVRTVHVSPELSEMLDHIEVSSMRHGHYFPGKSGSKPVHPSTVWRHVRDLIHMNTHSLRHRAGSTVYHRGGKDIRLTQEFLGHASPNTTAIYIHIEADDLRAASAASRLAA